MYLKRSSSSSKIYLLFYPFHWLYLHVFIITTQFILQGFFSELYLSSLIRYLSYFQLVFSCIVVLATLAFSVSGFCNRKVVMNPELTLSSFMHVSYICSSHRLQLSEQSLSRMLFHDDLRSSMTCDSIGRRFDTTWTQRTQDAKVLTQKVVTRTRS